MDFMWFWVSMGITVEVIRQSYKHCYPNQPKTTSKSLSEPLLNEDGTCPYSCCVKEEEPRPSNKEGRTKVYETDGGASTSDGGEVEEVVFWDEIEEYSESLIDKRKGKKLAEGEGVREILGTLYPAGGGEPKLVHFKWTDNYFEVSQKAAGAQALKREGSAKVHPQSFHGAAEEAAPLVKSNPGSQESDDVKHCVAASVPSVEHRLLPPVQEVMHHGHISDGGEIQPADEDQSD